MNVEGAEMRGFGHPSESRSPGRRSSHTVHGSCLPLAVVLWRGSAQGGCPRGPHKPGPLNLREDKSPALCPGWSWLTSGLELVSCVSRFGFLMCRLNLHWDTGCGVGMRPVPGTAFVHPEAGQSWSCVLNEGYVTSVLDG